MKLSLKLVQYGSPEYQASLALREGVRPSGVVAKHEDCSNEENCIHFGVFDGNELIATALLVPQISFGKMQRVGVIRERQNQGIGSLLLDFVEKEAMHRGIATIYCHAHEQAVPFYAKHGYESDGPYFFEHGIKHVKMHKFLL